MPPLFFPSSISVQAWRFFLFLVELSPFCVLLARSFAPTPWIQFFFQWRSKHGEDFTPQGQRLAWHG